MADDTPEPRPTPRGSGPIVLFCLLTLAGLAITVWARATGRIDSLMALVALGVPIVLIAVLSLAMQSADHDGPPRMSDRVHALRLLTAILYGGTFVGIVATGAFEASPILACILFAPLLYLLAETGDGLLTTVFVLAAETVGLKTSGRDRAAKPVAVDRAAWAERNGFHLVAGDPPELVGERDGVAVRIIDDTGGTTRILLTDDSLAMPPLLVQPEQTEQATSTHRLGDYAGLAGYELTGSLVAFDRTFPTPPPMRPPSDAERFDRDARLSFECAGPQVQVWLTRHRQPVTASDEQLDPLIAAAIAIAEAAGPLTRAAATSPPAASPRTRPDP